MKLFDSYDPALNATMFIIAALLVLFALVTGALIIIPIVVVFGIAKAISWHVNHPKPTPIDQLYAQTQQRSVSANFPDADKFMDAYLDRFLDAIRDHKRHGKLL